MMLGSMKLMSESHSITIHEIRNGQIHLVKEAILAFSAQCSNPLENTLSSCIASHLSKQCCAHSYSLSIPPKDVKCGLLVSDNI